MIYFPRFDKRFVDVLRTSMKPCMKSFGNLAFGSSSARKYLSTCVSCFQKFNVSYAITHPRSASQPSLAWWCTAYPYLELLMTVHEQHIHRLELRDEAVPLEFLPNLGADGRHGHVEGVHGLDFG